MGGLTRPASHSVATRPTPVRGRVFSCRRESAAQSCCNHRLVVWRPQEHQAMVPDATHRCQPAVPDAAGLARPQAHRSNARRITRGNEWRATPRAGGETPTVSGVGTPERSRAGLAFDESYEFYNVYYVKLSMRRPKARREIPTWTRRRRAHAFHRAATRLPSAEARASVDMRPCVRLHVHRACALSASQRHREGATARGAASRPRHDARWADRTPWARRLHGSSHRRARRHRSVETPAAARRENAPPEPTIRGMPGLAPGGCLRAYVYVCRRVCFRPLPTWLQSSFTHVVRKPFS